MFSLPGWRTHPVDYPTMPLTKLECQVGMGIQWVWLGTGFSVGVVYREDTEQMLVVQDKYKVNRWMPVYREVAITYGNCRVFPYTVC